MRVPFGKRRRRAREEALAWLARLKRGLRPGEGQALLAWLGRRSHRTLIARAAVEWHGPEVLAVLSELFPIDPAALEPRRRLHPAILLVAAVLTACIALIPIELGRMGQGRWYTTTPESTRRLALDDGTRVALNRGTGITVLYAEHIRSVLVARGEATFEVAREPHRPFHVRAAGRDFETKAGTFDVRLTSPDRLSLVVLAGSLTVFPALPRKRPDGTYQRASDPMMNRPILLEPLQMLTIEPDEEAGRTLTEQDARERLAWRGGT